jgi:tetratricopeptide (TPR) repeat protein
MSWRVIAPLYIIPLVSMGAYAEETSPPAAETAPKVSVPMMDTATAPAISVPMVDMVIPPSDGSKGFFDVLLKGQNLYLAGQYEESLAAYKEADEAKPADPFVQFYRGCAHARLSQYDDAVAAFQTAASIAGEQNPDVAGKSMFMTAVVEELRGGGKAVKVAWNAYKDFIEKNPTILSFKASADARIEAYDKKRELDEKYQIVRERIASGN